MSKKLNYIGPLVLLTLMLTSVAMSQSKGSGSTKLIDQKQKGEPTEVKTKDGFKKVYKNKDGEVFREDTFNSVGVKLETKVIKEVYPNGKEASVRIETYGEKNGKLGIKVKVENLEFDSKGKVTRSEVYDEYDDYGVTPAKKHVTENGKTIEYERNIFSAWAEVLEDTKVKPPELPDPRPPKTNLEEAKKPPVKGVIDQCLVGSWVSVSILSKLRDDEPPDNGAGVIMNFRPDGLMSVDYEPMSPMVEYLYNPKRIGKTIKLVGKSTAYIRTYPDKLVDITRVVESNVISREQDYEGNTFDRTLDGIDSRAAVQSYYVCTAATLSFETTWSRTTYRKVQ